MFRVLGVLARRKVGVGEGMLYEEEGIVCNFLGIF